jgi:hypothetical protein
MSKIPEKPNNNFNEMCELIKEELKFAEDKYVWYRTKSLEVTNDEIENLCFFHGHIGMEKNWKPFLESYLRRI